MDRYKISERAACSLVGLSRTAYRYMPLPRDDEKLFRAKIIRLGNLCKTPQYLVDLVIP